MSKSKNKKPKLSKDQSLSKKIQEISKSTGVCESDVRKVLEWTGTDQPPQAQSSNGTIFQHSETYTLYTDGSCQPNPGTGGWAYILRNNNTGEDIVMSGGERYTTNNRMEMLAVVNGLKQLKHPTKVEIVSDSKYVIDGMSQWMISWKNRGWTKLNGPIMNLELWKELDRLTDIHTVTYKWIKGHNKHKENEQCDQLAVQYRNKLRHHQTNEQ